MKNILFDARHLSTPFTGLSKYTEFLLGALINNEQLFHRLVILVDAQWLHKRSDFVAFLKQTTKDNPSISLELTDISIFSFKHYFKLRKVINSFQGFVYFYPHFDVPLGVKLRTIFVIHDLFPLVIKDYVVKQNFLKRTLFYLLAASALFRKHLTPITISDSTKKDIKKWFGKIISVEPVMVQSAPCLNQACSTESTMELPESYLFYIGDRRPHKNLDKMIRVFQRFVKDHGFKGKFLIAGSETNHSFNFDDLVDGDPNIISLGHVSDEQLSELYANMDALFFLSRYEGFGLPVLEAARYNRPIITSNVSSLPEVAPSTSLLLDPYGTESELACLISQYLNSVTELDNASFLQKFSWDKTASKIFSSVENY